MNGVMDDGRSLVFLAVGAVAAAGMAARRGGSIAHYGPPSRRWSIASLKTGKPKVRYLTADDLEEVFGSKLHAWQLDKLPDLAHELAGLENARYRDVAGVLEQASKVLGGFGVHEIPAGVLYVEMGDAYAPTILWEREHGAYIGSWGDVVEQGPDPQSEYECTQCGYVGWGDEFADPSTCRDCFREMYGQDD